MRVLNHLQKKVCSYPYRCIRSGRSISKRMEEKVDSAKAGKSQLRQGGAWMGSGERGWPTALGRTTAWDFLRQTKRGRRAQLCIDDNVTNSHDACSGMSQVQSRILRGRR